MYAAVTVSPAVADGAPATHIRWQDPGPATHSGFLLTADQDHDHDPATGDYPQAHGPCLVDDQPGLEAGLHLALDHGAAHLVDGDWLPDHHDDQPTPHSNGHGQLRGL